MNPEGLAEGKPHMIDNELYSFLFMFWIDQVDFILFIFTKILITLI